VSLPDDLWYGWLVIGGFVAFTCIAPAWMLLSFVFNIEPGWMPGEDL
jgi:hypothetical protein